MNPCMLLSIMLCIPVQGNRVYFNDKSVLALTLI
jgi:hypothetical protein